MPCSPLLLCRQTYPTPGLRSIFCDSIFKLGDYMDNWSGLSLRGESKANILFHPCTTGKDNLVRDSSMGRGDEGAFFAPHPPLFCSSVEPSPKALLVPPYHDGVKVERHSEIVVCKVCGDGNRGWRRRTGLGQRVAGRVMPFFGVAARPVRTGAGWPLEMGVKYHVGQPTSTTSCFYVIN